MTKILLLALVAAVIILVVVKFQAKKYEAFRTSAQTVTATVTERIERETRHKNRRKERIVRYQFSAEGGRYSGEEHVEFLDVWAQLEEGQAIAVYYDPKNPASNYPALLIDRRIAIKNAVE